MIDIAHSINRKSKCSLSALFLLVLLLFPMVNAATNLNTVETGPRQTQSPTWINLETPYSEAIYRDVEFINASHGWVVGISNETTTTGGIILYTEDGGDSWETQLLDDNQIFRQIDIVNSDTVWVTGLGRLFFTIDAGKSWETSVVAGALSGMSTVRFRNNTYGLTATANTLYETTDRGLTWHSIPGWPFNDSPRDIEFLNEREVWAIGYEGIYHSQDGAETWEKVVNEGGWSLTFPKKDNGWGISDGALLHMTKNSTWEKRVIPGPLPAFRLDLPYCSDIQFVNEQNGWIVGKETPVMHTSDGGVTWYEQSGANAHSSRLMAVCFIDETHGWSVGYDGCILRTSNGNNLDILLLSGEGIPYQLILGLIAVAITVPLCILTIHRKKGRISSSHEEICPQ